VNAVPGVTVLSSQAALLVLAICAAAPPALRKTR